MKGSMEMTQTHHIEHGTNMIMERSISVDLDGIDPHILLICSYFSEANYCLMQMAAYKQ